MAIKVLRGTFGRVWVDGELFTHVKSFEAKANLKYEDIDVNNEMGTQHLYMGYDVAGTLVTHKTDTRLVSKIRNGILTGKMPEIKFVGMLSDPAVYNGTMN